MMRSFDIKNNDSENKAAPSCFIFGAGEFYGLKRFPEKGDLIIAADGGLKYLRELSLRPDMIIGDFDSENESGISETEGEPVIIRLSTTKDTSDLSEALSAGIKRGFTNFYIYGCTGGRPDHTYAALQDMARLAGGDISCYLFARDYVMTAVSCGGLAFSEDMRGRLSVFSHTDVSEGVYESGLKYTVAQKRLTNTVPLGLSNEFTGLPAEIGVKKGVLIIMVEI